MHESFRKLHPSTSVGGVDSLWAEKRRSMITLCGMLLGSLDKIECRVPPIRCRIMLVLGGKLSSCPECCHGDLERDFGCTFYEVLQKGIQD